jgi:hypothetical protein
MTDASNEQGRIDQDAVGYGKPPKHSQCPPSAFNRQTGCIK